MIHRTSPTQRMLRCVAILTLLWIALSGCREDRSVNTPLPCDRPDDSEIKAFQEAYARVAEQAKTRPAFKRPDPPPTLGWTPLPGDSAEAYMQAEARFVESEGAVADQDALWSNFDQALQLLKGEKKPTTPKSHGAPAPSCIKLGFESNTQDPVALTLNEASCGLILANHKSIDDVIKTSRHTNIRTPLHPFSRWSLKDDGTGKERSSLWVLKEMKLDLLRRYAEAHANGGGWDKRIGAMLAWVRIGQDIGREGTLIGTMIGVVMTYLAADVLAVPIKEGSLSRDEAARLLAETAYARSSHISLRGAWFHEFLNQGALLVTEPVVITTPPGVVRLPREHPTTARECHGLQNYRRAWLDYWPELLTLDTLSYQKRWELYRRSDKLDLSAPLFETLKSEQWGKYDRELTVSHLRLQLVEVAAAYLLFVHDKGRSPASLKELAVVFEGLPIVDPITETPLQWVVDNGVVSIQSAIFGQDNEEAKHLRKVYAEQLTLSLGTVQAPQ